MLVPTRSRYWPTGCFDIPCSCLGASRSASVSSVLGIAVVQERDPVDEEQDLDFATASVSVTDFVSVRFRSGGLMFFSSS
jgi:hypothetical protein